MFDAIIVAGGAARRLDGADKPAVDVGGVTLLDRVIEAAHGAQRIVVVGPGRETHREVIVTREDPPGTGPVAAVAAGLAHVEEAFCLVLAADLPAIAPAVPELLIGVADADVAVLESGGRANHLAAAWRTDALKDAVASMEATENAAVRALFQGRDVVYVTDQDDWGVDCDTWADVERARHA